MTLKLNEEVTREQLKDLGFREVEIDFLSYYNVNHKVEINLKNREINLVVESQNYVYFIYTEIPTIIKTMIERGMC